MHRTQVYLQENIYFQLKQKAKQTGMSISELIHQAIQRDLTRQPSDAKHFFTTHSPLQSFRNAEPTEYVNNLRESSRILRDFGNIDE
jgi:hypothetical protein